jgi:hypothetical protein
MKAAQVKLGRIWTFTCALAQVAYLRKDGGDSPRVLMSDVRRVFCND